MLAVQRKTPDPQLEMLIESELEKLSSSGASLAELQANLLAMSLVEQSRPVLAVRRYKEIFGMIPSGFVDMLVAAAQLDEEELAAKQESLKPARQYLNIVVMTMNNACAVAADAILRGQLKENQPATEEVLDIARDFADKLAILAPNAAQVLDTRAMVAMASGDAESAIELSLKSVQLDPLNPGHRFTLAKSLRSAGRADESLGQATNALRALRSQNDVDIVLIVELQQFISESRG